MRGQIQGFNLVINAKRWNPSTTVGDFKYI